MGLFLCVELLAACSFAPGMRSSSSTASTSAVTGVSAFSRFPGGQLLPAGAQITSVVEFQGRHVAAGAYFPGSATGPSGCPEIGCNPMIWTSTNGDRWTPTWGSAANGSIAGEQLVVGTTDLLLFNDDESTGLWRSTDPLSWEKVQLPSDMASLGVTKAVWGLGIFVAILKNKYAGGPNTAYGESDAIWSSPNGITWTRDSVIGSRAVFASLRVDSKEFVVRGTADGSPAVWLSLDGTTWMIEKHA